MPDLPFGRIQAPCRLPRATCVSTPAPALRWSWWGRSWEAAPPGRPTPSDCRPGGASAPSRRLPSFTRPEKSSHPPAGVSPRSDRPWPTPWPKRGSGRSTWLAGPWEAPSPWTLPWPSRGVCVPSPWSSPRSAGCCGPWEGRRPWEREETQWFRSLVDGPITEQHLGEFLLRVGAVAPG